MKIQFFTSESVTEGHPDKICDQISDQVLDELLKIDPMSRCACETTAEPGAVHIMGEITSNAQVDYAAIAREVIRRIGYTKEEYGFTDKCDITCTIHSQSPDIAMGVDSAMESRAGGENDIGAGDQGMMFGYACNETPEYMPMPITLAHRLTMQLAEARKTGLMGYLRPDGKAQVTVQYNDGVPARVEAVVVSAQYDPETDLTQLRSDVEEKIIRAVIPAEMLDDNTKIYINPTGRFVLGGPAADTGLTGRKIIADTYGGYARHGGGAFSGKDATKVDRSAAYMARFIAKNIVAAGLANRCELQLSYSIGVAKPVSVYVDIDTAGTGKVDDAMLANWVAENIDLRPAAIIAALDLRKPIFASTAAYGHFGKVGSDYPWERIDPALVKKLQALA